MEKIGQVWGKFGHKRCLKSVDLKKCTQNEMKCNRFFLEVIFFGVFFGQMWGNLGKILRTPQNLPAPVLLYLCFITILFN